MLLVFGVFGYFMAKADFPMSPFVLAVIVGTNMEQYFRRAYKISDGSLKIFASTPVCNILLVLIVGSFFLPLFQKYLKARKLKSQH
jgi:putative tricarboxylic transport membrane protein